MRSSWDDPDECELCHQLGHTARSCPTRDDCAYPEPEPEPYDGEGSSQPSVRWADGSPVSFVAVYDVTREWGGPEEGGWWYDSGQLVETTIVPAGDDPVALRSEVLDRFPFSRKRYSMLGGDDYDVVISVGQLPAPFFPAVRPHYE